MAACCSSCTRASIGHRLWIVSKSQQRLLQNNIRQDLPLFNSYEQFLPILHFCLFGCIEEYVCAAFVILGDQYSPQLLVNLHVQNISSEYWKRKAHVTFPRNKLDSLHRTYFLRDKECMSLLVHLPARNSIIHSILLHVWDTQILVFGQGLFSPLGGLILKQDFISCHNFFSAQYPKIYSKALAFDFLRLNRLNCSFIPKRYNKHPAVLFIWESLPHMENQMVQNSRNKIGLTFNKLYFVFSELGSLSTVNVGKYFMTRDEVSINISTLHCGLTTLLTVLGRVAGLLMLQFGNVECHGIRGLTLFKRSSCSNLIGDLGLIWNEAWTWHKFFRWKKFKGALPSYLATL